MQEGRVESVLLPCTSRVGGCCCCWGDFLEASSNQARTSIVKVHATTSVMRSCPPPRSLRGLRVARRAGFTLCCCCQVGICDKRGATVVLLGTVHQVVLWVLCVRLLRHPPGRVSLLYLPHQRVLAVERSLPLLHSASTGALQLLTRQRPTECVIRQVCAGCRADGACRGSVPDLVVGGGGGGDSTARHSAVITARFTASTRCGRVNDRRWVTHPSAADTAA